MEKILRCKHCNQRLAVHDVWCVNCGRQSPIVRGELSAIRSLKATWNEFQHAKSGNVPMGALSVILGVIPIAIMAWLFQSIVGFAADTSWDLIFGLLVKGMAFAVFMPFMLIGFSYVNNREKYVGDKAAALQALKSYPRYLPMSVAISLYYVLIYLICFGLPQFGSDPILRLVWIVLAQYWVVVLMPVPALMETQGIGFGKAFKLSYRHFHVVRWNLYLMLMAITLINLVAALLLIVPLVITLPLTYYAIRDYTARLVEYQLLEQ